MGARGGERDGDGGAVRVGIGDRDAAMVAGDDIVDDGQAQTGTAAVTGPRGVKPDEPFEDAVALCCGDARSVVGDGEADGVVVAGDADGDVLVGVFLGVVDEVAHHSMELIGVAADDRWTVDADRGHSDIVAPDVACGRGDDVDEVDRLVWSVGLRVEAGEEQQVLGEVLKPFDVAERVASDVVPDGAVWVGDGDFEIGAQCRQRAA